MNISVNHIAAEATGESKRQGRPSHAEGASDSLTSSSVRVGFGKTYEETVEAERSQPPRPNSAAAMTAAEKGTGSTVGKAEAEEFDTAPLADLPDHPDEEFISQVSKAPTAVKPSSTQDPPTHEGQHPISTAGHIPSDSAVLQKNTELRGAGITGPMPKMHSDSGQLATGRIVRRRPDAHWGAPSAVIPGQVAGWTTPKPEATPPSVTPAQSPETGTITPVVATRTNQQTEQSEKLAPGSGLRPSEPANQQISTGPAAPAPQQLAAVWEGTTFLDRVVTGQMVQSNHEATPATLPRLMSVSTPTSVNETSRATHLAVSDDRYPKNIESTGDGFTIQDKTVHPLGNLRAANDLSLEEWPPGAVPGRGQVSEPHYNASWAPDMEHAQFASGQFRPTTGHRFKGIGLLHRTEAAWRKPSVQATEGLTESAPNRDSAVPTPQTILTTGQIYKPENGQNRYAPVFSGTAAVVDPVSLPSHSAGPAPSRGIGIAADCNAATGRPAFVLGSARRTALPISHGSAENSFAPHTAPTHRDPTPDVSLSFGRSDHTPLTDRAAARLVEPTQEVASRISVPAPAKGEGQPLAELQRPLTADVPEILRSDIVHSTSTPQTTAPQRADLPIQVARQLAEALHGAGQRPVDIALNPEELGRVRLVLSASDAGMVMHVTAERPDTLDLIRRHISELSLELRQIGYSDLSFDFAGGDPRQGDRATASPTGTSDSLPDEPRDAPIEIVLSAAPETGVDIRL